MLWNSLAAAIYISSRIMDEAELDAVIDHVVEATMTMAKNKVGALIVLKGQ